MLQRKPVCPLCATQGKNVPLRKKDNTTFCRKCGYINRHYDDTLGGYIGRLSDTSLENINKITQVNPEKVPNYRLRRLYWESYSLALIGKYHASMIFQGLLMENLVKEIILINEGKSNSDNFSANLEKARKRGYLNQWEYEVLDKIRKGIRNPYAHSDIYQMTKGREVPIFWVEIPDLPIDSADQMDEAMKSILSGKALEGRITDESGEVCQISMDLIDKERCIPTLNEIYDILVIMCERHFNDRAYELYHQKFGPHIRWNSLKND